ncbi:hypothetical protein QEV83_04855 [Methylocapsa sp. D3K7]|uniref:hypothetical protein n=1 Tax=Methylocapsa sp. D3K7 TaxID=3041435 RepID=UPI00244EEE3D|nr:hypothetical protein [Methylocapsa sp. D3K7]WGJ15602.1 hypothetical protein QEV83_04855 [Methylocapsa sp. D3K7]
MTLSRIEDMKPENVRHHLTHVGLILLAFELVKELVIVRVKNFFADIVFGDGLPFKTYEDDVLARHKDVFEASLLYLRDHFEAISADEMDAIQGLRQYRNRVSHELPQLIVDMVPAQNELMLEKARACLFRLSNFSVSMDIGADPAFKNIDWNTIAGTDLMLLDQIIEQLRA